MQWILLLLYIKLQELILKSSFLAPLQHHIIIISNLQYYWQDFFYLWRIMVMGCGKVDFVLLIVFFIIGVFIEALGIIQILIILTFGIPYTIKLQ